MTEVTLGGERLGGGKKNKVQMHGYGRSNHDLSYIMRTSAAAGTLIPFMTELALPGDTFDIDLDVDVMTLPTIGPLFGSYKIHLDVFQVPIRLYQGALHMNMLGIGNDMSKVLLPQVTISGRVPAIDDYIDNQQMNPSAIFKYLGISGLGWADAVTVVSRNFNAVPWLGYWDIYKNYYANKQENKGAVIANTLQPNLPTITEALLLKTQPTRSIPFGVAAPVFAVTAMNDESSIRVKFTAGQLTAAFQPSQLAFEVNSATGGQVYGPDVFTQWEIIPSSNTIIGTKPNYGGPGWVNAQQISIGRVTVTTNANVYDKQPQVLTFPLGNIDTMRTQILQHPMATAFTINSTYANAPYKTPLQSLDLGGGNIVYANQFSQEGLALRTYQSDLFNNWIDTVTVDGPSGITAVTAVNVVAGKFTLDELNLSMKVYNMLNRIALSGGSYDDWLDAVYTHDRTRSAESPMYLGGMLGRLIFQEVISNTATQAQPLGTLAGRGKVSGERKGGKIIAKIDEPSYIMGIFSLVPNIDYSQGNKWDTNLRTLNDLHKPALDEIGYQNLITDQMAWFDTRVNGVSNMLYQSAGKQPAWINYMTNVNKVYGTFADESQQMFMTLNRRYEMQYTGGQTRIADLTTYIDPMKFNHIFADTRRDAQNFWVQIGVGIEARRKMSAKVIPNL